MNVIRLRNFYYKVRRRLGTGTLEEFRSHLQLFDDKVGLEIGGPSKIFQSNSLLPIYARAKSIDGVNFSDKTIWEGAIKEGKTYAYANGKKGNQFICEGNQLTDIADKTYDFLLSSHNLEHFANPLKAVAEWRRVLKPCGLILLILPDKRYTFDHRRPVTTLAHLESDYKDDVGEDDLTHLEEILQLHDISLDPPALNKEFFRQRSIDNFKNRCLHHHVFDGALLKDIFFFFHIEPVFTIAAPPFHLVSFGRLSA